MLSPPQQPSPNPNHSLKSVVIAISGGSGSGKKTVQKLLKDILLSLNPSLKVDTLHLSDFKRAVGAVGAGEESGYANSLNSRIGVDIDPERKYVYDFSLLADTIERIRTANNTNTTDNDNNKEEVLGEGKHTDVLIVEGVYIFTCQRILNISDIKIFIDSDADVRLGRSVLRDVEDQGLPLDAVLDQYVRFGKAAYELHSKPTKVLADLILPGDGDGVGVAGVELIAQAVVEDVLGRRGGRVALGGNSAGPSSVASTQGVGLVLAMGILSEADLAGGQPSYYETV